MKKSKYPMMASIFMILFDLSLIVFLLMGNALIIPLGIKLYRSLQAILVGGSIIFTGLYVIQMIVYVLLKRKENPKPKDLPIKENKASLDVTGRLSDDYVCSLMANQGLHKWKCLQEDVKLITDQLVLMNSYQERLSKLLENNNMKELADAEDLLERIEQQILSNVRKVLNFMEILSPNMMEDRETVKEYMSDCVTENIKLLNATKDFLICVTGFVNDQGLDGKSLQMMEEFKTVLMGSIHETVANGNENITLSL